jgi:hypothetical protein
MRVTVGEQSCSLRRQPLETGGVESVRIDEQRITVSARDQRLRTEGLPQLRDVDSELRFDRPWRPLAPELVDYALARNGLVPVQE